MPSTSTSEDSIYTDDYSLKFPHHHSVKPTLYASDSQRFDIVPPYQTFPAPAHASWLLAFRMAGLRQKASE